MQELEAKFGRPHPELEGFKQPHRSMNWLVDAFFRLHRRRQHGESGFQPIGIQDAADFSDRVLRLRDDLRPLFFRTIEDTDNAVLFDHYAKVKEDSEKAVANAKQKPSKRAQRR